MSDLPPPPPSPHDGWSGQVPADAGGVGFSAPGMGGSGYPLGYSPQYGMDHPRATAVLVLGILSLPWCLLLGPVAWAMGNSALKEIDAAGGHAPNRGQVVAGKIMGMIASLLLGGIILLYGLLFLWLMVAFRSINF